MVAQHAQTQYRLVIVDRDGFEMCACAWGGEDAAERVRIPKQRRQAATEQSLRAGPARGVVDPADVHVGVGDDDARGHEVE